MADFVEARARCKPLDFAKEPINENFGRVDRRDRHASTASSTGCSSRRPTSRPSGTTSPPSSDAGVEAPATFDDLLAAAKTIKASGLPAYSIGGADGWTLTDLFENIYLRQAGAGEIRPARQARDPVDRPVGQGRAQDDGEDRRRHRQHRRRPGGRARDGLPDLGHERVLEDPEGRDGDRGRLRAGRAGESNPLEAGDGLQRVRLPVDRRLGGQAVVGGGDLVIMFKDDPAAQAFIEYLRRPRRPRSGRSAAGSRRRTRSVDASAYPDPIQRDDREARSARRRRSASTSPTCSRPRSAAPSARALEAVPGLPEGPEQRGRDRDADGGRGSEGVRLDDA